MQGPDLTNSLTGVLTRFRKESVAMMSDIESMFYQVHVRPDDSKFLRYLWWPDGDLNRDLEEFQMLVHLFGGISSPSCASYALQRTADDNATKYDKETIYTIRNNFYVDDCLKSVETEDKALQLVDELRELLKKGGFNLTKWVSNSRKVIKAIPETQRACSVTDLDLDHLPIERALGLQWDVERDVFKFKTTITSKPATRRGILSMTSSIYDPLGFISPYVLPAKFILQDLCRQGFGWDDPVPEREQERWNQWLEELPKLKELEVNRCLKPKSFGEVVSAELHNFSDASQLGYGAVSYLRLVNGEGIVHCAFIMGKSRLTPIKQVTIPRLELAAAVVATRLSSMIIQEIDMTIHNVFFWTDSTCVLGYILNQDKRFKTFVANRLSTIHEVSRPEQWRYVNTTLNPADDASRGLSVSSMLENRRWIEGPAWLRETSDKWPEQPNVKLEVQSDDLELKGEAKSFNVSAKDHDDVINRVLHHYSSWYRLKRCIAFILRYRLKLLTRCQDKTKPLVSQGNLEPLCVEEMNSAEAEILKYIQRQSFHDELSNLRESNL